MFTQINIGIGIPTYQHGNLCKFFFQNFLHINLPQSVVCRIRLVGCRGLYSQQVFYETRAFHYFNAELLILCDYTYFTK